MPTRIFKTGILRGFWEKLGLGSSAIGPISASETIVPVIDVQQLSGKSVSQKYTLDVSAAPAVGFLTCLAGHRYTIRHIFRGTMVSATASIVLRDATSGSYIFAVYAQAAQVSVERNLQLKTGDYLELDQGNVADSAIDVQVHYIDEDI